VFSLNLSKNSAYHTQRNNEFVPISSCNVTAAVMALKAAGVHFSFPSMMQPEDYLYTMLDSPSAYDVMRKKYPWAVRDGYPPNQVHGMLKWGINRLVGKPVDKFVTGGSLKDMLWYSLCEMPLIMNGRFTAGGHMLTVVGFRSLQDRYLIKRQRDIDLGQVDAVIVDDPYGNYHTGYEDAKGNDIWFPLWQFHSLTNSYNADGAKWMHIINRNGWSDV
jgi:hypothetical protein